VIKVQTFWRGVRAWRHLKFLRQNAFCRVKDRKAVGMMTGPYTLTQFLSREMREFNLPLNFYDKHYEFGSAGRNQALTKRDHADGYVRVGVYPYRGPEFQSWQKRIADVLPAFLSQLNTGPPGAAPMCILPMVVDYPSVFFDTEANKGFSSVWRESLVQVANLAATYGIFRVFQVQDIARVRAFLDFWGGRSAHRVRLLCAITEQYDHPFPILGDDACLSDPITDVIFSGSGWGKYGYESPSGMPSWFIAILNALAAAVNKDAPLA